MSDKLTNKVSRTPYGVELGAKLEPSKEGERFDPAVPSSPSGVKVADLRVYGVGHRPATVSDLIEVLEGLGAEKWMWCVTHEESSESGLFCAQGVVYQRKFDCRMVDVLVWRIG